MKACFHQGIKRGHEKRIEKGNCDFLFPNLDFITHNWEHISCNLDFISLNSTL